MKRSVVPWPDWLDPDASAVPLDDLLADGQADAGAGVLVARVQALEDDEDPLRVLAGRCRSRCRGRKIQPFARSALGGDVDRGASAPWNLIALPIRFWKDLADLHGIGRATMGGGRA